MNNFAVNSFSAFVQSRLMNLCAVVFSPACFPRSVLGLRLFSYLLVMFFPQNVSTSSSGFEWNGQLFFQAQPRLAAHILQTSSRQSRAHNHRLLSALLNGPIDQAGLRLVSVLRDQNYLAVSPVEQIAALAAFRSPSDSVVPPSASSLVVTEDMRIALADDILERADRLTRIPEDSQPEMHAMAKNSLDIRLQRYAQWSNDILAAPVLATPQARFAGSRRSVSPPGPPPRGGAFRHRIVPMATLSDESDLDAQQYFADQSGPSLPHDHRSAASPAVISSLSASDLRLLVSFSALPPIPSLGGWGSGMFFRSPALREKAVFELQQMDAGLES